jgi:hypothetical protein
LGLLRGADFGRRGEGGEHRKTPFKRKTKMLTFSTRRTKKFLKKQQLRDWLRVVSTSRGVYELKFFNVVNDDGDEDDE